MSKANESAEARRSQPIEREIRFAVVIYGGVSLAVYINGVVQELLHMVRSTALTDPSELTPVEKVYRKLASVVGDPQTAVPVDRRSRVTDRPFGNRPGRAGLRASVRDSVERGGLFAGDEAADISQPIYSRFVVDILSGTSAGGINAIYLAKALVNNQSIESLARMWITDADMVKLLNDHKVQPGYLRQNEPTSLLASGWMYFRLLTAFAAMNDKNSHDARKSPSDALVDDLDLYCTTTDLYGLPMEIALTGESVQEERYRNFYHFKQRRDSRVPGDNSLTPEMDPFLAFAARCTSSFPFAFEPMVLRDISAVIANQASFRHYRAGKNDPKIDDDALALFGLDIAQLKGAKKFADVCRIYQTDRAEPIDFARRPFGDGGYLDNKPFSYAIETMKKRHAALPVDRKLIYIEPNPETIETNSQVSGTGDSRPNAIQNSMDALIGLPRYETIRQDIEGVIKWNADINRLHRVIDDTNRVILNSASQGRNTGAGRGLDERLSESSYWRLRLSGAADQLSARMAEAINVNPSSAQGQALRSIAGSWRDRYFRGSTQSEQRFLDLFDFDYCERAIRFLRTRLQQLPEMEAGEGVEKKNALQSLANAAAGFLALANEQLTLDLTKWHEATMAFQSWTCYLQFIVDPGAAAQLITRLYDEHTPSSVPHGLFSTTDESRDLRVQWLFDFKQSHRLVPNDRAEQPAGKEAVSFQRIVDYIAVELVNYYSDRNLRYATNVRPPLDPPSGATCLQKYLSQISPLFRLLDSPSRSGWEVFQLQDRQVYPIIFGTSLGEFETVDIFRISPAEARTIQNTVPPGFGSTNPPLRGACLGAFGAFLDQRWRLSDMLRGRLDGAERLITAILPDSDDQTIMIRETMIRKAQEAIAIEWQSFQASLNLNLRPNNGAPSLPSQQRSLVGKAGPQDREALENGPRKLGDEATSIIADVYRLGVCDADPHNMLSDIARSTTVIGRLLDHLALQYSISEKKITSVIVGAGRIFWGFVEVSVPESTLSYLFRNGFWIIGLLGVLILVLGIMANARVMWSIGIALVTFVVVGYWLSNVFRRYMATGTEPWKTILRSLLIVLPILGIVGGAYVSIRYASNIAEGLGHLEGSFRYIANSKSLTSFLCGVLRRMCIDFAAGF